MVVEGLLEYEAIRDFLYSKMRGYKERRSTTPASQPPSPQEPSGASAAPNEPQEETALLKDILQELAAARAAAERISNKGG